ncbi:hypothetical protein D3C78_1351280 [compost metagenome]
MRKLECLYEHPLWCEIANHLPVTFILKSQIKISGPGGELERKRFVLAGGEQLFHAPCARHVHARIMRPRNRQLMKGQPGDFRRHVGHPAAVVGMRLNGFDYGQLGLGRVID